MHSARTCTTLIIALMLTGPVAAADIAKGKALHDKVCTTCHQSDYYTRKNSIIHSRAELTKQVTNCQTGAGENWTTAQIEDVAAYLNATYYKFK
jgi:mono/diheme cytochrome c family protein